MGIDVLSDANTGELLWSISGGYGGKTIADGKLVSVNEYNMMMYCFGKGKTGTDVLVTKSQIAKGESVGITGTVMDLSPAQPNTPAVSKNSMVGWMEYLHMQKPKPTNTTGVEVTLTATKSDGTQVNIGTATSDADGVFRLQWTPTDEDLYKITASFAGDDSYWGSQGITTLMVGSADFASAAVPTASPSVVPSSQALPIADMYIIAAAAIVVVAIAAVAVILHKRK
jgi:hypothetical protein